MKKIGLLLASVGAGLLLVGGTVAAYIVSTPDTIGVRVSPGSIDTDKTGRVTLSWGSNTMHRVSNLVSGQETEIGQVKLAAEAPDVEEFENYEGAFKVAIQNLSTGNAHDLMNYLTFKVYEDAGGTGSAYGEATALPAATENADHYYETKGTFNTVSGHMFKVTVTLTASAGDSFYEELLQQNANATFDWGIRSGSDDIDTRDLGNVYYAPAVALAEGEKLYANIYKGGAAAASYPGLEMTEVYKIKVNNTTRTLYTAAFDTSKYTDFKFIKATPATGNTYTYTELAAKAGGFTAALPWFDGTNWAQKPNEALEEFYVRGIIGGIDHWGENLDGLALTLNTAAEVEEFKSDELVLSVNDAFKIYVPELDEYFSSDGNDFVVHAKEGEYVGPGIPGTYTIYVRRTGECPQGWSTCTGDKAGTYFWYIDFSE